VNVFSGWLRRQIAQERSLLCRYEDLVQNPKETLSSIGMFIGQDLTVIVEKLLAAQPIPPGHTLAGNAMRISPITGLKHDLAWSENLSPKELRTFDVLAGWLNRQYGYQ
jgi:hypothetical protein